VAQAAGGLGHRREPGPPRERPGLAVAGHAREHDPGVGLGEHVVAEVPPLERARAQVLDHHVRLADEVEHQLLAARLAQVERDAPLAARLHRPEQLASAVLTVPPAAQLVGLVGRLDLDHVGAEVGHQPPCERTGDQRADLEHAHPVERGGGHLSRSGHFVPWK
jgi:hypothetical protein